MTTMKAEIAVIKNDIKYIKKALWFIVITVIGSNGLPHIIKW